MAASTKRYYWLKLKEDFFRNKVMKKMRRIAGGDTYVIICLKMMLMSIQNGGKLFYEGVEQDFCAELALDLDEDEDNVKIAVSFLMQNGRLVQESDTEFFMPEACEAIGSESASAERMRKMREKKALADSGGKTLSLLSFSDVSQCDNAVSNGDTNVSNSDTEIEKEIEIDIEKDNKTSTKSMNVDYQQIFGLYHSICKSYPKLRGLSEKRKKAIKARARVHPIEDFQRVFENAEASNFLKGSNNRACVLG